ncbi:hypothetical protein [Williamsia sp. DF01-3]|uniref:hypothetical protein n=1 Tax=Williamsia sp. DF01-3 TaxID=2934157 RepID=UPI001FF1AF2B|nr:hypothetical protein [Williamsia sp. DF01-3]MCK0517857.1 hypothetical protein [Williamsia sp. DF01-3]
MPPRIPQRSGGNKKPAVDPLLKSLLDGNFIEFLFRLITGDSGWFSSNGFLGGVLARITEGATLIGMRWTQVDDLQVKTQKLLGVIGYGAWYADQALSDFTGTSRVEFNQQVGPVVGCSNDGVGRITLNSQGLWRVDYQIDVAARAFGASDIYIELRVYQPNQTTLHTMKRFYVTDSDGVTCQNSMMFTVPSAGYKVGVYLHAGTIRNMPAGIDHNGLYVLKISDETS